MATADAARARLTRTESSQAPSPAPDVPSLIVLLRFATAMAMLLAVAAFPRSTFFQVREVAVSGARQISVPQVIALSGMHAGDLLFAVPAEDVAARVTRHPRVAAAQVHVTPGGRVQIAITERAPYAAVLRADTYVLIDPSGVAIEARGDPAGLPVIRVDGLALPWVRLGDHLPDARVEQALAILQELPAEIVGPGMQLRLDTGGDFSLVTPDALTVRLGQEHGLADRAGVLPDLLSAVRRRGLSVEYIDIRYGGNVVLRPAGATPGAGVRP